jgi:hemoglobin
MIVEYIRYRVAEEDWPGFLADSGRAAQVLARAPQCIDFELSRSVDEPTAAVLRIGWTSAEDLQGFRGSGLDAEFRAALGRHVTDVEETSDHAPTPVRGTGASVPSLYAWVGGLPALERLTRVFYDRVLVDDLIGPLFAHMDDQHPQHVAMWLAEVFGGPDRYTRERGGYPAMLGHHLGKAITEPQRRRWVSLLLDSLDEAGLPADPEFRAAFVGYVEWGTRLALTNSQPGAEVVRNAPVPHWGWGVAPPWLG